MTTEKPLRLTVLRGDITTLDVDAIVNAANERMLGGGGVDGAIHRAAGPGLVEECRRVPDVRPGVRCPTGEARITTGHRLRAGHVIHTVGPVWQGGDRGEPALLASCYRSSLAVAAEHEFRSVAFPAISCGVYGYPLAQAVVIAVRECAEFVAQHEFIDKIIFACFDRDTLDAYRTELERLRHD